MTLAVYIQVRHHPFIDYDDGGYVVKNAHVKAGLTWDTVVWSFTTTAQDNWHPLTYLSHSLDCQLFGLNAGDHHLTSLFFHLLNGIALFLLMQAVTGRRQISFLVAALFALHPFNVDSVAWIAERKNVLSTLFFLLSLWAYVWYARRPDWRRYAVACVMFALGLLAKPMLVTLPFILLLLDYWPLQRISGWGPAADYLPSPQKSPLWLLLEKIPLFALSGISSALTIYAQKKAIAPLQAVPILVRLLNAVSAYFLYVWKTFIPFGFAIHYPNHFDPYMTTSGGFAAWGPFFGGVVLLLGFTWICWTQRLVRPYLAVGWLWYLGSLVPVIGIVQVGEQGMADRYAYIPLIGIFIIAVCGAAEIAGHFRMSEAARVTAAAVVLLGLSLLTYRQVGFWESSSTLWLHAHDVNKGNARALDHVGGQLVEQHRMQEAMPYFEQAADIAPGDADSHLAIASDLQDKGKLREAIKAYEVVVHSAQDPEQIVQSYFNLCIIFGELGDFSRSHEAFARAANKDPEITGAKLRELDDMVYAQPSAEGFVRIGLVGEQVGLINDARAAYLRALKINPGRTDAQKALDHLNAQNPMQ